MSTIETTYANLGESYRSTAVIYREQAARHALGSLGETGNTTEARKYEAMADRAEFLARQEATK